MEKNGGCKVAIYRLRFPYRNQAFLKVQKADILPVSPLKYVNVMTLPKKVFVSLNPVYGNKVNRPKQNRYKALLIGERGYSSCNNLEFILLV